MKEQKKLNLFENIALTFSGGGYRASTFSLGILSYFNDLEFKKGKLLDKVKGLSTVSGGTLTGATFSSDMANGKTFSEFYTNFYAVLKEDKLLGIALNKLETNKVWRNSTKRRTLINAFALSYKELLTDSTFEEIKDNKNSHLEDICFNATDFSFGLAFRFQTTGDFGNYRLKNDNLTDLSKQMKLADAIASSSCFPMGFEPMVMPDDYVDDHNNSSYIALKTQDLYKDGVGVMDGGIVDNQGIGSIIKADNRRKNAPNKSQYDLIMVCDVGSYFMDPWKHAENKEAKDWGKLTVKGALLRIKKIVNQTWWFLLPLLAGILIWVFNFISSQSIWAVYLSTFLAVIGLCGLIFTIIISLFKKKLDKKLKWLMGIMPHFIKDKLQFFDDLKLRLVERMLEERGTSAFKMINDIFLKQIRRLNYNLFYSDDKLKNRRITALIYQLTEEQFVKTESDEMSAKQGEEHIDTTILFPGDRIFAAAKIAREMETTLWFNEEDIKVERLKNLVSCGQFTACYNLLVYCNKLKKRGVDTVDAKLLDETINRLNSDWEKFVENPYWLHNKMSEIH